MLPVSGVVAEARHLCDILDVLPVQHTGLTERFGVGTNARPSGCGGTEFVKRRSKCYLKSCSGQYDWGGRSDCVVGIQSPDLLEQIGRGGSPSTAALWGVAPSTAGSFLRSFTFGHVRQLDKAAELGLVRAWSVGAAPERGGDDAGARAGVVCWRRADLDSTVCEVCGKAKHGAAYGHTKVLGYHPLVAVRSDTGEVLHSRMRSGSSQRGNVHFARETLARLRRLAPAAVTVRADAGFFSYDMIAALGAHGASYSITIPQNAKVKAATEAIDDDAWTPDRLHPRRAGPGG